MIKEKPELLMPAGSFKKLQYAYAYGADACYVGVPLFSLRARENEFNLEELKKSIDYAHDLGKKVYVTANIFAHNRKIAPFEKQIGDWIALKPDALIMSDPGLMLMVRERFPDIPIHLSVQANCMNWQNVRFWHKSLNVERVILSRELNLTEIKEIKNRVPEVELEAFVHGSICIAYSGRCLMSSYFSHRDANQGVCDNSCRENFHIYGANKEKEPDYYLEDLRNKGEFYQIDEDENGTYIMNSKDLMLIEHLKEIAETGVCSFKVEGRTKTEYYVSLVTRTYRQAIDDMMAGAKFDKNLLTDLDKVANRGYHTGFMIQNPDKDSHNYKVTPTRNYTQRYAGLVPENSSEVSPNGYFMAEVRNRVKQGQDCEILGPNGFRYEFKVDKILNPEGQVVDTAHGGTGSFFFEADVKPPPFSVMSLKEESPNFKNN